MGIGDKIRVINNEFMASKWAQYNLGNVDIIFHELVGSYIWNDMIGNAFNVPIPNVRILPDKYEIKCSIVPLSEAGYKTICDIHRGSVPQKISLNLAKQSTKFNVNDILKFNAVLEPLDFPDFKESFDLKLSARTKNIQAFGFFMGAPQIINQNQINSVDSWFLNLREIIRKKILNNLSGDVANVSLALLIGEQKQISKNLLTAIRNSGLSHLLSISGFHLSLASAIFFVSIRWLLVRIEYIALRFDIKKISAIFAILASYFYLKIADAPLPAQRALIMVWMVMLSLLINRKFDGKRALFLALFLLVLFNPHNL
jgi:competence protein ComEC